MSIMEYFGDWQVKSATFKQLVTTQDPSTGAPVESETTVASGVEIGYWTGTSRETSISDKFVDQAIGAVILAPTFTVTTTMWMEIDGKKHYIIGVDNIAGFDEVLELTWRREYA